VTPSDNVGLTSELPPRTSARRRIRNLTTTPGAPGVRTDIQALRAVAVALVVLYHLWPGRLTGGFIGVDVFFVISGYLITAHLIRDALGPGRISLTRFWSRRARRLLPAAFVVLLFCISIAVFVMRSQSEQNLWEIIAAALYVENWALAYNSVDYLAAANAPSLVQHFWSLSAEEQFYIFWPILIASAALLAARVGKRPIAVIAMSLALVFLASLTHSVIITFERPDQAYFFTTARAWEFAAGGLAALIPSRVIVRATVHRTTAVIGWVGLGMILVAAMIFSSETPFPGYAASIPILGTVLVLLFGTGATRFSVAAASNRRLVLGLGDISYGLYLWHWPLIIVSTTLLGGHLSFAAKIAIIIVAILAAYGMKRLIEDPARFRWTWLGTRRGAFVFMAAGIIFVSLLSAGAVWQQRAAQEHRYENSVDGPCVGAKALAPENSCKDVFTIPPSIDTASAAQDVYWRDGSVQAGGACAPQGSTPGTCILGARSDADRTIAFIGSSHGQHLLDPLHIAAVELNWKLLPHVRARCSGFDSPEQIEARIAEDPSLTDDLRECQAWGDAVYAQILDDADVSLVVISARSIGATDHTRERISALQAAGKHVIWLGDTPDMPTSETAPQCVERAGTDLEKCRYAEPEQQGRTTAAALGVPYIDLHPNFCVDGGCRVVIGGVITFFDNNHLTLTYARTLAPYLQHSLESLTPTG